MKTSIPFSRFADISRHAGQRPIALWGAGNICTKTIRRLPDSDIVICDNSANMWGGEQEGHPIISPELFQKEYTDRYVIICTTSFAEVSEQLSDMGLTAQKDFIVSPILNDLRIIDELETIQCQLLVSSGAQPSDDPEAGGGLYQLDVNGTEWHYKKVLSGCCHCIIEVDNYLYTVDDERGILQLDRDFNVIRSQPLPTKSRGHGIAYHAASQCFFIACSLLDAVLVYDRDLSLQRKIPLSVKAGRDEGPFHHTNDCCIVGDSLYVSMFSETGNWKRDIFDGAVIEFDIVTGERIGTPIRDLWMPHNIQFIDGCLTVLDSLRGGLRQNNASVIGEFAAFTRGLAFNGHLFFVGQSRNRNFSKNVGVSKNISIDTGVVIFDPETKVSRFLQLPSKLSEIHGLFLL